MLLNNDKVTNAREIENVEKMSKVPIPSLPAFKSNDKRRSYISSHSVTTVRLSKSLGFEFIGKLVPLENQTELQGYVKVLPSNDAYVWAKLAHEVRITRVIFELTDKDNCYKAVIRDSSVTIDEPLSDIYISGGKLYQLKSSDIEDTTYLPTRRRRRASSTYQRISKTSNDLEYFIEGKINYFSYNNSVYPKIYARLFKSGIIKRNLFGMNYPEDFRNNKTFKRSIAEYLKAKKRLVGSGIETTSVFVVDKEKMSEGYKKLIEEQKKISKVIIIPRDEIKKKSLYVDHKLLGVIIDDGNIIDLLNGSNTFIRNPSTAEKGQTFMIKQKLLAMHLTDAQRDL